MSPLAILQWMAAGIIAGVLFVGGCSFGENKRAGELSDLKVEHAQTLQRIAGETVNAHEAAAEAAAAVRLSEQARAQAFAAAEKTAQEKIAHAQADAAADTRACFLSGRCRLRQPWACPATAAPTTGLPGAATDPGDAADGARLREAAVGRVIGIGKHANELIALCVASMKAERQVTQP